MHQDMSSDDATCQCCADSEDVGSGLGWRAIYAQRYKNRMQPLRRVPHGSPVPHDRGKAKERDNTLTAQPATLSIGRKVVRHSSHGRREQDGSAFTGAGKARDEHLV